MTYSIFVAKISELTHQPEENIKAVLLAIPTVLVSMKKDEMLRTPLGPFRMTYRKARAIKPPKGTEPAQIREELIVKLRSGKKLKRPV